MFGPNLKEMNNVQFELRKSGEGSFFIMDGEEQIAKMEISVRQNLLTVYHTEVAEKSEGKGFAKALLNAMVEYARTNNLKVRTLCSYVHFQFSQHPELYSDVWQKEDSDK